MDAPRVDFLLAKSYDPDVRVRRTVSALVGAGFAVRIIAWDRTGRHLTVEDDHGVPIHRVKVRSRPSRGWTQVFYLIRVARRILPLLRQGRPTVLHAVNLPMLGVAVALVPFLGTPRPIIVYDAFEIHALMGVDRYPAWLVRVIALVERYLPRFADLVITPGEDRRRYFEDLGIASVAVPNWIDPPSDLPDRDEARRELGIAEGQFCLVYAGGIIGSRDLQPLVEHARTHPDDLVLIAGSGDAVDELQRAAAGVPNVRLLGWLPDPSRVLAAADGLYYALKPEHPYAKHAAPNNLYQAVALALPLIYREQGELALVGADRRIGIPFSDQSTLAAAVDALRSAATRDAIRRDLQSLRERFRWSAAAGRLVGAYSAVLRPRKRLDELAEPPLLLLTRIWPTRQRPSVGSFIRARAHGVPNLRVVKPRWYGIPRLFIYAVLLFDALRASRRIRGVEAHMLIPTGFVGLLVARLRQVPLVVYAHGRDVRDWQRRAAPLRWLARFVANRADRIVTNSEDTAGYIRAMGVEPIVAPPGADLARFAPSPRPARRGRVLYLGGRNRRKGYAVAADLADTLVGPWLRDVDPDEVPALIAEHDVVLMPSLAEPFGLVAVEAIASGRWVVASAVGGLRDIVIDGVNGTLVEDGDFAGALERIPDYDPHMVARTVERFSLEAWQHELARIWDDLDSRKTDGG